jgi:hypothetical protein
MMVLTDYHRTIQELGFEEFPYVIHGREREMSSFINFQDTDIDLQLYLAKVILRRCFSPTMGDLVFPWDYQWFMDQFFDRYQHDYLKPGLSKTIREAAGMIHADEPFTKGVIATTFLFGVIEFYIKYELGFHPMDYDFFDPEKKAYMRQHFPNQKKTPPELSLGKGWSLLMQQSSDIGRAMRELDEHHLQRLQERGIDLKRRWVYPRLSERLSLFRNTMLHGEHHSFYSVGHYLLGLYTLFHLCRGKAQLENKE